MMRDNRNEFERSGLTTFEELERAASRLVLRGIDLRRISLDELVEAINLRIADLKLATQLAEDMLRNPEKYQSTETTDRFSIGYRGSGVVISSDLPHGTVLISDKLSSVRGMMSGLSGRLENVGGSIRVEIRLSDRIKPRQICLSEDQVHSLGIAAESRFYLEYTAAKPPSEFPKVIEVWLSDIDKNGNAQPHPMRRRAQRADSEDPTQGPHKVMIPKRQRMMGR
ncbi:MAG: hypothetical protein A3K76_02125 [Euryarchaeota archaeon RBG_13_57_23]|nr:MAG: hypothetical protein A3K76_02125 [Euryarchaeota archaeon RBG_13_57_23]HJX23652.1 hypothetical protein [Candidatus Bathyarchaeia archaeon]